MDQLKLRIEAYKSSLQKIGENRNLWASSVKDLIYNTLSEVKKLYDLDWYVQKVDMIKNLEAVNIHFNKQASGFIETVGGKITNHTKHGGALIFSQAYNGQVFIIYSYPYVENWVDQRENKLVIKISPEEINKDFILKEVEKFIDEMTQWESSTTSSRIGFNTSAHNY